MVFPDHRAVFAFNAFAGHARPHHFRQAVNIHRINTRVGFNLVAHRLRPWLCTKNAEFQAGGFGIQALALKFLNHHLHVAGRAHDDAGLEIGDQLHLLFGLPTRHRDDGATRPFHAVMRPQAAGEQAVAISHMHQITRPRASSANRPRHQVGPGVNIF